MFLFHDLNQNQLQENGRNEKDFISVETNIVTPKYCTCVQISKKNVRLTMKPYEDGSTGKVVSGNGIDLATAL